MNRKFASAGASLAVMLATVAPNLLGQTAPAPSAAAETSDETIELSPFVVESTEDANTYQAKATLAGTRIRTELKDVGSAISVVTEQFLKDTGAKNSQDLLVYTTSTEVGGTSGNFAGAGTGARIDTSAQRIQPQNNTRVRGLTNADNTRDFFLTDIPWDSYSVGRIDLQRAPNAILFGIGSPAGIVNGSLDTAAFKDSGEVELRFGSFGSNRVSAEYNEEVLDDELAFRIAGLHDKTYYRQDPAFQRDKRLYTALRWDPKFIRSDSARTSFKVNYEKGDIDANRPRIPPPIDAITPWFNAMNQQTYAANRVALNSPADVAANPTNGAVFPTMSNTQTNPNYQPWIDGGAGGQIFDQPVAVFGNNNTGVQTGFFEPSLQTTGLPEGVTIPWSVYRGIQTYDVYANKVGLPNQSLGAYKAYTLTDPGVFDFYNKLIDGPTKSELQDFEAYNISAGQTLFNNKVGFEAVYDRQKYTEEQNQLSPNPWLSVDVFDTLPDGSANPNVGRAYIVGAPNSNRSRETDREALRLTGFGELDFTDLLDRSTLGKILGRHVFTGLYMEQSNDQESRQWYGYVADSSYRSAFSQSLDSRRIPSISYLGDSLLGTTLGNANIPNITSFQAPTSGTASVFDTSLKPGATAPYTADSVVGWTTTNINVLDGYSGQDRDQLYSLANKFRDEIDSGALVWQGYFFDGVLVPTVGWRKDTARNYNAGDPPQNADTSRLVDSPLWTLPSGPDDVKIGTNNVRYNEETGKSTSWSVVLHTPKRIREKLPYNTDFSIFYNKSDNFQPAGGRTDVFGQSIASPTGETKDYGVTITTLNDRLTLKMNWYETTVKNSSLDGGGVGNLSGVYMVGYAEAWGRMFATWSRLRLADFQGSTNYAYTDPNDPTSGLIDSNVPFLSYQPAPGQSVADAKAAETLAIDTLLNNPPPADFKTHWNIADDSVWAGGWGGYVSPIEPSTLAVTGDTQSKGVEFELAAQPTPNWNIAINLAKTTATRSNLAESFGAWVDERYEFYQGPAGDVRLWNGAYGGETVRSKFINEFYGSYQLYRLLEGADVPELRPWRLNVVTNYNFKEGLFKGANIGGAYRWQDEIVTGFPIVNGTFDIDHPYKGKAEDAWDFWMGYQRKLTDKVTWRIQLNIRNVFASDDLIPITVQPDGTPATSRIPEPRVWSLTNTLSF